MKKKLLKTLVVACMTSIMLIGCGTKEKDTTEQVETITITDVRGDLEIPKDPKRIVDISGSSDILSILGYKVIGTANSDAYDYTKLPSYLEDTLKDAEIVGYSYQDEMDVEAIMNLKPDLIIMSTRQEKMYDQLSDIAPTVMVELAALNWKDDIKALADVLNKQDVANTWLSEYEAKSKAEGEKIKKEFGEDTSYLSFLVSGDQLLVFDGAGFGSVLYDDMLLAKPIGMPTQSDVTLPSINYEGLAAINADYIFVLSTDEDFQKLSANSIWSSLPAVQAGHVVKLNSSPYFNQGYSPIGRELLVDEIGGMLNETK